MNHITKKKNGKKWIFFLFTFLALSSGVMFLFWSQKDLFSDVPKSVDLVDNGLEFSFRNVSEKTVGEFLETRGLGLREKESVFPSLETRITPGMRIAVARTHEVTIQVDGGKESFQVHATSVGGAIKESGIVLDGDDIVKPDREKSVSRGTNIVVTRVQITEEFIEKPIAFSKKTTEDDKLSFRKTIVTQKGESGIQKLTYKVSKHDGKEVNRTLLRTETIKEPVTEVVTVGTYVKLGKSHTGAASWYAWTGTMAAANPWLPKGSYVKVTNVENGKSVIVVINDRGPFVPGRIIDLDKVAFQKIASVGAGVINVKMEEIVN